MPVVNLNLSDFGQLVGRRDVTSVIRVLDQAGMEAEIVGQELRVEVPHNRPDLLTIEGVARLVKGMLGVQTGLRRYRVRKPRIELQVEESVRQVRPFIRACVVRRVNLTEESLISLMQAQEKLHETYCRRRRKASIGVYDLDTITPPIYYRAVQPDQVSFVPLGMSERMSLDEILRKHPKGAEFAHLLEGKDRYPILVDSRGTVLSMPPIVNSEDTKVTVRTRNLFIDVTGTDERVVVNTLKILMCALAERGFTLEEVKIVPRVRRLSLTPSPMKFDLRRACKYLGIRLTPKEARKILRRMRFEPRGDRVLAPPYRVDLMHEVDLIEELAIGYGYDRIEPVQPRVATVGGTHPLEEVSRKARLVMLGLGFTQVMNYILTNPRVNFEQMLVRGEAVEVANPVSEEFTILRTWLLPSLMQTCARNRIYELPQKFFEVGDVVIPQLKGETVATYRKLAAAWVGGNFTQIKAVVEAVLRELRFHAVHREGSHPSFMEGRVVEVQSEGRTIGLYGEVHPLVLQNFELRHPVAAFELTLGEA